MSEYYDVYVRGMIIDKYLRINIKLATFDSFNDVESYLKRKGSKIIEQFMEDSIFNEDGDEPEPGVFYVIKTGNFDINGEKTLDDINHTNDVLAITKYPTFAFNDKGYEMLLNEHYLNKTEIPINIAYVSPFSVEYGISERIFNENKNMYDAKDIEFFEKYNEYEKDIKRTIFEYAMFNEK
jgi:hypothetical protein